MATTTKFTDAQRQMLADIAAAKNGFKAQRGQGRAIGALSTASYVTQGDDGLWRVTPAGTDKLAEVKSEAKAAAKATKKSAAK